MDECFQIEANDHHAFANIGIVDELSHRCGKLGESIFCFVGFHLYIDECGSVSTLAEEVEDLIKGWYRLTAVFGACHLGMARVEPTAHVRLTKVSLSHLGD